MKYGHLTALVASVESGGIRAGARKLGVSQAAVTRSLKELELSVGMPLITRSSRGIQLTASGKLIYNRASTIANQMSRLSDEIDSLRSIRNLISFNAPVVVAMTVLPIVVEKLQRLVPETQFSIGEGNITAALPLLRNGELDFTLALTNGQDLGHEFNVMPLFTCEARLVVRKGNPLAKAASIKELLDADWILTPDDEMMRGGKHYFFREFGLPMPRCTVQCRTTAVGLPMVYAGKGVAIMAVPLLQLSFIKDLVDVIPVVEDLPKFTYSLISRADLPLSDSARQICKLFQSHGPKWRFSKC